MEKNFYKSAGLSLVTGSVLAIITMILHPYGGNLEYIIKIATPIRVTHALAITCLPFILFGFYGITQILMDKWKFSMLAFIIIAFGIFSALLAALFNGLVLPYFLIDTKDDLKQHFMTLELIAHYSFAINKALDYVFICAVCISICMYSLIILKLKKLPISIGYLGLLILFMSILGSITNFSFTSLYGFRIFVFSMVVWILCSAIALIRFK